MLAAEHYQYALTDSALFPTGELLEIHRSKISLHRAKAGYDYPAIRLPFTFSGLIGLSMRIYQTVHEGALAFLVVVSPTSKRSLDRHENASLSTESPALTWRRSPVRIRPSPSFFLQSEAVIVTDDEHDEEEKLHNSNQELHNSDEESDEAGQQEESESFLTRMYRRWSADFDKNAPS